jgi:hypothetical protein
MWKCPKCSRDFDNQPPHHFCDNGAVTIGEYIAGQAKDIQPHLWDVLTEIKEAITEPVGLY